MASLSKRPYFTRRAEMVEQIESLREYNGRRWAMKQQTEMVAPRPGGEAGARRQGNAIGPVDADRALKITYGVKIMPKIQQVYRITREGGGGGWPPRPSANF